MNSVRGKSPVLANGVYIANSADVIGDVVIGEGSSVWFRCVIRGDVMPIRIGVNTNIQDGTIIHGTYNKHGVQIGDRVTVGHGVILHGCSIGNECLIGMGSVIMDGAVIPDGSIVGAGSLITEDTQFEKSGLILGRPAKWKRDLKEPERGWLQESAKNYLLYKKWYENDGEINV